MLVQLFSLLGGDVCGWWLLGIGPGEVEVMEIGVEILVRVSVLKFGYIRLRSTLGPLYLSIFIAIFCRV